MIKQRTRRSRPSASRDMSPSSFSAILADLVERMPGALGAVLVDGDGEAVDYTGELDPFDLKLAGAHWQIVVAQLRRAFAESPHSASLGRPRSLIVRGARRTFIAHALPDDYAIVLILSRGAGFSVAARAFAVCERALASEAGWRIRARDAAWFPVQVASTGGGRPQRVRGARREHALEILGQVAGPSLGPRERGWRVRIEGGAELTLIREPGGHWYSDEPPDAFSDPPAAPKPTPS